MPTSCLSSRDAHFRCRRGDFNALGRQPELRGLEAQLATCTIDTLVEDKGRPSIAVLSVKIITDACMRMWDIVLGKDWNTYFEEHGLYNQPHFQTPVTRTHGSLAVLHADYSQKIFQANVLSTVWLLSYLIAPSLKICAHIPRKFSASKCQGR